MASPQQHQEKDTKRKKTIITRVYSAKMNFVLQTYVTFTVRGKPLL